MFTALVICSLMWAYGSLSILYAFREPPPALRSLFVPRVPILLGFLLLFLPERHHIKAARISIGGLILLGASLIGFRVMFF